MDKPTIQKCLNILKQEAVPAIALCCALLSMLFVPPSPAYLSYIDFRVLALLFCLMAVVAGFQDCGVFAVLAQRLLSGKRSLRFLTVALVLLPFFSSMLITNDVALITFVPFTLLVLGLAEKMDRAIYIIVLQTVAANLGSMATPVGNPQNLFLYTAFNIHPAAFFSAVLPLTLVSLIFLTAAALCSKRELVEVTLPKRQKIKKRQQLSSMVVLFLACLLSVFHILDWRILLAIVLFCLLLLARHLFKQVDYGLLFTFLCFFIFAGNIGSIPVIRDMISAYMEKSAFFTSLLASQVISNVPAAILLSGFTQNWRELLLGVNIGTLGTLIASLASLISFRLYLRTPGAKVLRFLGVFTLVNLASLAILMVFAVLLIL